MTTEVIPYFAQFGFAGIFAGMLIFYVIPELRRLGRSIDRLAMSHLMQLAESECLGDKIKEKARELADEIKTGKDDLK